VFKKELHNYISVLLHQQFKENPNSHQAFFTRFIANATAIEVLYQQLYGNHPNALMVWNNLLQLIIKTHQHRPVNLLNKDTQKLKKDYWFVSNELAGMSLYVDRFCGNLVNLNKHLPYFAELGVNVLHLMPLFESPAKESDGGYAVSNFRKIDKRFGNLDQLRQLQQNMERQNM
jgi:amylosucrase